jgi:hypothetical protein
MFVASPEKQRELEPGVPGELFEDPYDSEPGGHQQYGVSLDGQRFLMIRQDVTSPTESNVLIGLFNDTANESPIPETP